MSYCKIVAPADGIVTRKSVEIDQNVSPGQNLLTLVPLQDIWVTANFKETQLKHMEAGQSVKIHVDATGKDYSGRVTQIGGATGSVRRSSRRRTPPATTSKSFSVCLCASTSPIWPTKTQTTSCAPVFPSSPRPREVTSARPPRRTSRCRPDPAEAGEGSAVVFRDPFQTIETACPILTLSGGLHLSRSRVDSMDVVGHKFDLIGCTFSTILKTVC